MIIHVNIAGARKLARQISMYVMKLRPAAKAPARILLAVASKCVCVTPVLAILSV